MASKTCYFVCSCKSWINYCCLISSIRLMAGLKPFLNLDLVFLIYLSKYIEVHGTQNSSGFRAQNNLIIEGKITVYSHWFIEGFTSTDLCVWWKLQQVCMFVSWILHNPGRSFIVFIKRLHLVGFKSYIIVQINNVQYNFFFSKLGVLTVLLWSPLSWILVQKKFI